MTSNQLKPKLRSLVVGSDTLVPTITGNQVTAINFDNAASTPPFHSVLNEIINFSPWYSSVHRGNSYKSILSTDLYEKGREIVKNFVKADPEKDIVIYTKSTTESINLLSYILQEKQKNQVILSTAMEHLANDLPWRDKFFVDYIGTDQEGRLQMNDLENKLTKYKGKVKLVAVTGASNVTGYVNPIHEIARIAHRHGAEILVDGAQLVPHLPVNMKPADSPEHIDYLVFSAHKMYAPFGIGILIGPRKTFEKATPVYKGGGCVRLATRRFVQWDEPPAKDEAGSPNLMGIVALIAAIKSLQSIGMERIEQYESQLTDYAMSRLKTITDLNLYTHCNPNEKKVSIIPFNIKGMPHELVTKILSVEDGIAVRNGLFCAHPYLGKLLNLTDSDLYNCLRDQNTNLPGMVRISFGLYNEYWEIDRLIKALTRITTHKNYYLNKYTFQNSCCR